MDDFLEFLKGFNLQRVRIDHLYEMFIDLLKEKKINNTSKKS
jgi:hypothetical protein